MQCPPVLMEEDSNQGQGQSGKRQEGQGEDKPKVSSKNPVQNLNEIQKGLVYEFVSETGEGTNKSYTMSVEVGGEKFEGTAANKKLAKVEAAKYALLKMFNILYVPVLNETPAKDGSAPGTGGDGSGKKRRKRKSSTPMEILNSSTGGEDKGPLYSCKNPIMLLNECKKDLKYDFVRESAEGVKEQDKTYTMSVDVDGQMFEGTAKSKKLAKNEAAKLALETLFNVKIVPESEMPADPAGDNAQPDTNSLTSCEKKPHHSAENSMAAIAELHSQTTDIENCVARGGNPLYLRSRDYGANIQDPVVKQLQMDALRAEKDKFVTEKEVLLLEKSKILMEKTLLKIKIEKLKKEIDGQGNNVE